MDDNDETAFTAYAETAWPTLVRAAVFLGAGMHEAEDLAQQTLVRCYGAWERVNGADNRDAYVYRMLVNALRDERRTGWWKRRRDLPQGVESASGSTTDASEAIVIADAVHRALDRLTKPNRDVVVLRYFAQLSEAQTASALGIPAGTVKSRLSRALTQLADDDHLADVRSL
ncbi:SigE family RNA polymerase sigma factor [Nocardioides montaniterrae]